jgi:hypothetical protein
VNRWYASAIGVLVVGLAVAFLVVPFDQGDCPVGADACTAYGYAPRVTTIVITALVALVLTAVGSMGAERHRRP